ncbi:Endoglucanase 14 [Senna tora]|uniref:Endoglucanase 14 n=1 Tax=Senna tora TaxID=362788 RepID=A0A834SSP0_9FABA|nr:Endoglucanase 14 [Senna tora]
MDCRKKRNSFLPHKSPIFHGRQVVKTTTATRSASLKPDKGIDGGDRKADQRKGKSDRRSARSQNGQKSATTRNWKGPLLTESGKEVILLKTISSKGIGNLVQTCNQRATFNGSPKGLLAKRIPIDNHRAIRDMDPNITGSRNRRGRLSIPRSMAVEKTTLRSKLTTGHTSRGTKKIKKNEELGKARREVQKWEVSKQHSQNHYCTLRVNDQGSCLPIKDCNGAQILDSRMVKILK